MNGNSMRNRRRKFRDGYTDVHDGGWVGVGREETKGNKEEKTKEDTKL